MAPQPRRPVGCFRSCLRGCLRGLNYLLAIIGVLMVAYSVFMYIQWSEATPEPSPSPPAQLPSSVARTASSFIQHASHSSESLTSVERLGTDTEDAIGVVTSRDHEMASDEHTSTDDKSSDDHKKPYAMPLRSSVRCRPESGGGSCALCCNVSAKRLHSSPSRRLQGCCKRQVEYARCRRTRRRDGHICKY